MVTRGRSAVPWPLVPGRHPERRAVGAGDLPAGRKVEVGGADELVALGPRGLGRCYQSAGSTRPSAIMAGDAGPPSERSVL